MPTIDMPLDELEKYQGINPRPKDFDDFWTSSLQEMDDLDPNIEIIKANTVFPGAELNHLYFTGTGGGRVHAKYLKPIEQNEDKPCILFFHGYSWHSGEWSEYLKYIYNGYSVLAMDVRGQGGLSVDSLQVVGNTLHGHIIRGLDDKPEKMFFRNVFLDTALLAKIAMGLPGVDRDSIYASGGSQGGALTLICAALEPRIKKAAACYPFLSDYKRVWEMDLFKDAYKELNDYFRFFDPNHEREDEIFTKLGYIDVQNFAQRIKADVLCGCGLSDSICPPSSQFAVYNKIKSNKEIVIYPEYGHEYLQGFNDKIFKFFI